MILSLKQLSNQIGVEGIPMINEALILAAGRGKRLKPLTDHAPKCLTEVHGTSILAHALQGLSSAGIHRCTIVVGYLSSAVEHVMGSLYADVQLKYVYNSDFDKTNDMYSLWLASEMLERGVLLMEGDIYFSHPMLHRVLIEAGNRSCYVAGDYDGRRDEVVLSTNSDLRIERVDVVTRCPLETGPRRFISAGMLVLQRRYCRKLSAWLMDFVNMGRVDLLFDVVISEHLQDEPIYVSRIGHDEWVEIDTGEDLKRAERTFGRSRPF
jgi:choline kinase